MKVSVRLNLPKNPCELTLSYNTFEKVTYDQYFMTSLALHAENDEEVKEVIDELTGKGSLNSHFEKLYNEVKKLSEKELEDVLDNSLFPVLKIDTYKYVYIPILDISLFGKTVIKGNLSDDDLFPRKMLNEGETYVEHQYKSLESVSKADNYIVNLTDDNIEINVKDNFYEIKQEDFENIIIKENLDILMYPGLIFESMDGSGWIQLNKSTFNNILDSQDYFIDNGNHFGISNNYIKESRISYKWGMYWIKETIHRYNDPKSTNVVEKGAEILMTSGRINEIKNKTLVEIIKNINRDFQQEIINYVLSKKDVKDLALNGIYLINKGYEKGWTKEAIKSFYKFKENDNQLFQIYKIEPNLDYTIDELVKIYSIDRNILIDEHNLKIQEYYQDYEMIIENINKKVGEMITSALRDNLGKMKLDDQMKKLKRIFNKYAHAKKDIKNKNLNELRQYEQTVNSDYNLFKDVQKKFEQ